LLGEDLPAFDAAVAKAAVMVRRLQDAGCPIEEVNTGGGLGAPLQEGDSPLDLDAWARILARHLGPLGVTVGTEPGEIFTKHAGVLLAEVVTVEERLGTTFVGLAAGFGVMPLRFVWGEFVELVHCTAADAPRTQRVTVSGHINEAPDLFAEDYPLPPTREGDVLAIIGVGCYSQAVAMPHCLRLVEKTIFFHDRLPVAVGS
jgi:diaminopimelate decarboxylase